VNQTVDILCRAREIYAAAPSHAPSSEFPDPGTYCVIFAIDRAVGGRAGLWTAVHAVERAMAGPTESCVEWNAEHSTAEVLAAFDRAIAAQGLIVPPLQHNGQRIPAHAGQES
jgi:hypothetical protein